MVANEHLGQCVKVCLTDIWVTKSQNNMEDQTGKMCNVFVSSIVMEIFMVSGEKRKKKKLDEGLLEEL